MANFGVGSFVITEKRLDEASTQTAFWLSVVVASVLSCGLAFAAPHVADLMGQAQAATYLRVLSLSVFASFAAAVPAGLLLRGLRYRAYYCVQVTSAAALVLTELALALAGWGALSVAVGQTVAAVTTLLGWSLCARFRPRAVFARRHVSRIVRFAGSWSGYRPPSTSRRTSTTSSSAASSAQEALGLYYIAYVIPNLLRQRVHWIAQAVFFPVFSRLADDDATTARYYGRLLQLQLSVALPALLIVAVVAEPLLAVVFGTAWTPAAPALSLLCVAAFATTCARR